MKKKIILWAMLMTTCMTAAFSQVGIGTDVPHPTAMLDVTSTEKGFLPPRMTTAQRDSIASPAQGLVIYNTDEHCIEFWNTTQWLGTCDNSSSSGTVIYLDCAGASSSGTLTAGIPASGVSSVISYTGGNGGSHSGQIVNSTGINGLTAIVDAGSFANGNGTLTYTITGTPLTAGTASFEISIGGQTCTLTRTVAALPAQSIFTAKDPVYNGNSPVDTRGIGYYDIAIPSASTITLEVDVQTLGAYDLSGSVSINIESPRTNISITPQTLTYTASGTFTTLGLQNVTFTPNVVTPKWYGSQNITISGTGVSNTKVISPRIDIQSLSEATQVTEVVSATGRIWMDRNLGAHRQAVSFDDLLSTGSKYQWGRGSDGHQVSVRGGEDGYVSRPLHPVISTLSSTDQPGHSNPIRVTGVPSWRSPVNDNLWQGVNGINNPCPSGFRLPSRAEYQAEILSWSSRNTAGAFASPLKFSSGSGNGSSNSNNTSAFYWPSSVGTPNSGNAEVVGMTPTSAYPISSGGVFMAQNSLFSVRCIKN